MPAERPTVAVLGGGLMATAVATRLRSAGYPLRRYNRTQLTDTHPADTICASPAEAATDAAVIWSWVHDNTASHSVWSGPDGVFSTAPNAGSIAIESSTLSTEYADEWHLLAERGGMRAVYAPVTGGPHGALAGRLVVFAGGHHEHVAAAQSAVLDRVATTVVRWSTAREAAAMKLVNNLQAASILMAYTETLLAAEALGISPSRAAAVFSKYGWATPVASATSSAILLNNHTRVTCKLSTLAKDLEYAVAALGDDLPPVAAHAAREFAAAVHDGYGELDMSAIALSAAAR